MATTKLIRVRGVEHGSANDAVTALNFTGDHAVQIGGRFFTVTDAEFDRLQTAGVRLATWHHHEETCQLICVPA